MQAKIAKWGNSLGVRLPRHMTDELRLEDGATVELQTDAGSIRIIPMRRRFKLSDLLANEPRKTFTEAEVWGEPVGEEIL